MRLIHMKSLRMIYLLLDQQSNEFGLGRIGKLEEKTTLAQFAEHVKTVFGVPALRFVGDPNERNSKSCGTWRRWQ